MKVIKNVKSGQFYEFLKTCSVQSNSVTRQVNLNRTKVDGKGQYSNTTFLVIVKHCACKNMTLLFVEIKPRTFY